MKESIKKEVKQILTKAFEEVISSGGEIASRREFYIVNLGQTLFPNEQEARKFVAKHEIELNQMLRKIIEDYSE